MSDTREPEPKVPEKKKIVLDFDPAVVGYPSSEEKKELAKTFSLDVPRELATAGGFDCLIESVRGPNAVVSEAWLAEVPR